MKQTMDDFVIELFFYEKISQYFQFSTSQMGP